MLFRINQIGLFQNNKKDILTFNDEINFISGESNTGKSSIGEIIDYCLGASRRIPGSKIEEINTVAIYVTIDVHHIVIARNRFDNDNFAGQKYMFTKAVDSKFSFFNIEISYFNDNKSAYLTVDDFIELEITKFFPSFPPKTRLDGNEMVRPTVRNMPPFIFQTQGTITNKDYLFYQMNSIKSRGIKRDFELFLGLINHEIYNKINRKNEIEKELKRIRNAKNMYETEVKKEFYHLKSSYHRLFTHLNKHIDVDTLGEEFLINIDNLNILKFEYSIDSNLQRSINELEYKLDSQTRLVDNLRIEEENIRNQIKHIDTANLMLQVDTSIGKYSKRCPMCDSSIESEIKVFENAKQKIFEEKNFLHSINRDILNEKHSKINEQLIMELSVLKSLNIDIKTLKKDLKDADTIKSKEQLLYEIKGMIKNNIETIIRYNKLLTSNETINKLENDLEQLKKDLSSVDLKKMKQEAELLIGQYATEMLDKLTFDRAGYGDPNLKFDIKDVTAYQHNFKNNKIYNLSDIGSAENHLSFHLAVFLGLHKYIVAQTQSILPSLIFLDQPSQVYFPTDDDFKNKRGDIKKVEHMYKSIIGFIEEINKISMFNKIQIIVVDHFYSSEEWYQKHLVEARWDKETGLALIK